MTACDDREVVAVDHPVPWTVDSTSLTLPRDGRVELVDGTLLIGPGTTAARARAVAGVRAAVRAALPDGLRVLGPVPLRLGPDCVLVPDLVVTRSLPEDADAGSDAEVSAAAALMVVEVVGREHGVIDRSFKPQLYARSRIPYSLLIDHDGPFAVADMILGGRHHEYARAAADEVLRIEEPFPLEIDLAAVTCSQAEAPGAQ